MEDTTEKYVRVIADLTRTRFGLEGSVVRLLKRYCDETGIEKSVLAIIVAEQQRQYVAQDFDGATILVLSGVVDVRKTVMEVVRGVKEEGPIQLLSYGRDVLELEKESSRIRALSFGRYRQASNRSFHQQRQQITAAAAPIMPVANKEPEAVPTETLAPEPAKPVYRSEVFQEILIKRRLGPFPDHRPLVFDEVEKLVKAGAKVRVSELLKRAIAEAKKTAEERNKANGREHRVDDRLWAAINKFSEQLLLSANVLIGPDNAVLGTDWRSRSQPVIDMAARWRAVADGQLILGLIDEGESISSVEAKNVSRAIYHSSSEENENRVNEAVLELLDRGILEESSDGNLRRVRGPERIARLVS